MRKRLTRSEWKKRNKQKKIIRAGIRLSIVTLIGVAVLTLICIFIGKIHTLLHPEPVAVVEEVKKVPRPEIVEALLTPNEYSRPEEPLEKLNGVVVHYTANPNTTGWENRNYFENLKESKKTKVSSHFIIGLDGTIIACIPLDEIAYASNERNEDTISIECCHPKKDGVLEGATYKSLIALTAWLMGEFEFQEDGILRHYDVTGKNCPKDFVEHPEKWEAFKKDVKEYITDVTIPST